MIIASTKLRKKLQKLLESLVTNPLKKKTKKLWMECSKSLFYYTCTFYVVEEILKRNNFNYVVYVENVSEELLVQLSKIDGVMWVSIANHLYSRENNYKKLGGGGKYIGWTLFFKIQVSPCEIGGIFKYFFNEYTFLYVKGVF